MTFSTFPLARTCSPSITSPAYVWVNETTSDIGASTPSSIFKFSMVYNEGLSNAPSALTISHYI